MKEPFPLPATFEIRVTAKHPLVYEEISDPDDRGYPDLTRMQFRAVVRCDGKHTAVESPSFEAVEPQVFMAYNILRECLTDIITHSLLPDDRCPKYELVDGLIMPAAQQPPLNPEPLPLNTEQ